MSDITQSQLQQNQQQQQESIITPELKKVLSQILGDKCTIQSIAIVKLYTASQNSFFQYSDLTGLLCLVWDREREAPFFRMFNPENLILTFECELYVDFHKSYKKENEQFYYFELIRGFIGLSFAFISEAEVMQVKVNSSSPKSQILDQQQQEDGHNSNHNQQQEKKKELFGFRRGLKKLYNKVSKNDCVNEKEEDKNEQLDEDSKIYISKPMNFNTVNSIKLDQKGTIDIQNMDEKMKNIFQQAGITEEHLKDQDYASYIFDALVVFNENISGFLSQNEQDSKQVEQSKDQNKETSQPIKNSQEINKTSQKTDVEEQQQINNENKQKQDSKPEQIIKKQENNQEQVKTPQSPSLISQNEAQGKEISNPIKPQQQQIQENTLQQQNINTSEQQLQQKAPEPPALQNIIQPPVQQQNNAPPQPPSLVNILAQATSPPQPPSINSIILNSSAPKPPAIGNVIQQQQQQQQNNQNSTIKDELNQKLNNSSVKVEDRGNMLDQIKMGNFKLKSAKDRVNQQKQVEEKQQNEKNLTNYLAQAIAQRRNQLKKNYQSSSNEQTSSDQYSD